MPIFAAIKEFFGFGKAIVNAASQHERLVNTPEQQEADRRAKFQNAMDDINRNLDNENLEAVRRASANPLPRVD